jgi:hypothetical protein
MTQSVAFIGPQGQETIAVDEAANRLRLAPASTLVVLSDPAGSEVIARVVAALPRLVARHGAARAERRIDALVESLLDVDPFAPVEAQIDADNAEMRAAFLEAYPALDSATLHARAGHTGRNAAQTAASWKRAGRIFAVTHKGRDLFPAFQFDADGRPLPLVRDLLAALPGDLTPWQRAFWLASPSDELDGDLPVDRLRAGDPRVVEAARGAGRLPIG